MADEANRTGGLFLPYPLLGILMTLILALGGGIIGLYAQLSSMQTTMLLRDGDYRQQLLEQKNKVDQLEIYLHNDREKLVELTTTINQQRKGRSN